MTKANPVKQYFTKLFPIAGWIMRYNLDWLVGDLIAGLTIGLIVVPQSLAYAKIIGLPLQYGLYSSFVGVLIYMFFATSKDVTIGPSAVVTLMTAQMVGAYPTAVSEMGIVSFACTVAIIAGLIELFIGFFRLGMVVNFVSGPAIAGFTTGAAIATQISQLPSLMGISGINNNAASYKVLYDTFSVTNKIGPDIGVGLGLFFFLVLWRLLCQRLGRNGKLWPVILGQCGNFLGLVIFTAITYFINLNAPVKIRTFGYIPRGLSHVEFPKFTHLDSIIPASAVIVLVAIIEHIAVTKSFGRQNGYKIDPNQEIIALGFTNAIGSVFGSFPTTGSFSRSAVKSRSGVATPAAGIITGSIVLFSIYMLTDLFGKIPNTCLAAIICFNLIDLISRPSYLKHVWRVRKTDFLTFMLAFWFTMFFNIQTGVYASVGFSVANYLFEGTRPKVQALVKEEWGNWVGLSDLEDEDLARVTYPPEGVAIFRIEDYVSFSNANHIQSKIAKWVKAQTVRSGSSDKRKLLWCENPNFVPVDKYRNMWTSKSNVPPVPLRGLILDFSCVNNMDHTGLIALIELRKDIQRHAGPIPMYFVHVKKRLSSYVQEFFNHFEDDEELVVVDAEKEVKHFDLPQKGIYKTIEQAISNLYTLPA